MTGGVIEEWLPREIAGGAGVVRVDDTSDFSVLTETVPSPDPTEFVGEARMNLHAISFETLQAMGVSVDEAARFVAYRQRRGGLMRSLEEIDSIPGLSDALRGWLKTYGAV